MSRLDVVDIGRPLMRILTVDGHLTIVNVLFWSWVEGLILWDPLVEFGKAGWKG